jgi:hypothetical protein
MPDWKHVGKKTGKAWATGGASLAYDKLKQKREAHSRLRKGTRQRPPRTRQTPSRVKVLNRCRTRTRWRQRRSVRRCQ